MRTTAPSTRRRNAAWLRHNRRWLAQKRDDDSDGFASGEDAGFDSGFDSGDDLDDGFVPQARPVRPAPTAVLARPTVGAALGAATGIAGLPQVNRVVSPIPIAPAATQRAPNNVVAPIPITPGVTLGAAEDGDDSDSVSDGISSGIESASGDEFSEDEQPPAAAPVIQPPPAATSTIQPPPAAPPVERTSTNIPGGVVPPVATTAPAPPAFQPPLAAPPDAAPVAPAPTTTTAPAPPSTTAVEAAPVLAPAEPGGTTSSSSSSSSALTTLSSPSSTGAAVPVVTQTSSANSATLPPTQTLPGLPTTSAGVPDLSTTLAPVLPDSPPPASDVIAPPSTTAFGGALPESNGNALGSVTEEQNSVNAGAAAGIVIGVLALIGIFIGAGFLWRKFRNNGKSQSFLSDLPVFNRRIDKDDGSAMSINEKDTIPILPPPSLGAKKTNSEMMDDLMQATFKAENGGMDSRPGSYGQMAQPQPDFMNETTYTALAGPPTPVAVPRPGDRRSKPVIQWLDNVRTPSQAPSTPGSTIWPAPDYPPMPPPPAQARGPPDPFQQAQQGIPVGRPPADQFMPPAPPFRNDQRYTQTTTTTATSSSEVWYG
ncbi:hypothetical protein OQA88_4758 [Cercophora sp. LCS_1]